MIHRTCHLPSLKLDRDGRLAHCNAHNLSREYTLRFCHAIFAAYKHSVARYPASFSPLRDRDQHPRDWTTATEAEREPPHRISISGKYIPVLDHHGTNKTPVRSYSCTSQPLCCTSLCRNCY